MYPHRAMDTYHGIYTPSGTWGFTPAFNTIWHLYVCILLIKLVVLRQAAVQTQGISVGLCRLSC